MYTKIFLRLEPLGIELIAASCARAGHEVRLIDLQVERHADYFRQLREWQPDVVAFSCNYLANVPEVIELAKAARGRSGPRRSSSSGGHSASFVAGELLDHAEGAIDCVLKGEGEASVAPLRGGGRRRATPLALLEVPGRDHRGGQRARRRASSRTSTTSGPPATCCGIAASTSSACSTRARRSSSAGAAPGIARSAAPGRSTAAATGSSRPRPPSTSWRRSASPAIFIVDDVAFIQAEHGMAIGEAIARRGIKKQYYLETRGDVLLRNKDVFRFWKTLGLQYMFLGVEAIDEEGLKKYRKRVTLSQELRGARVRPVAGDHGGDQPHRRPRLGPPPVRGDPPVVPGDPRDRQHQREHALPGHRELADRIAPADHARLSALRHPARRAADPAAAGRVLRGAREDPAGAQPQAPGLVGREGRWPESWPATWPGARPTRSRCSGSSTASTTPRSSSPTIASPSATRCRSRPSIAT